MLYQSLLATALLVGSSSAEGIAQRQAEASFTTVVTMTLGPDESDRPLICPCPMTSYSANPITGGQYTLPVTSASLATAKKRQDPTTTTITENLPGSSVIIITATCTCPVPSGGSSTTPTTTAPTTVSGATTAAPLSTSTIRASSSASLSTSSAPTSGQGNGASFKKNFKGGRTFGAVVAAMVAGAAFLALVA